MWSPEWLGLVFWIMPDRDSTLPKLCRHKTVGAPSAAMLPSRWGKRVSGPDPAVRRMFVTMSNLSDIHLSHRTFLDYSSEVYGCVALEPVSTVIIVCNALIHYRMREREKSEAGATFTNVQSFRLNPKASDVVEAGRSTFLRTQH
jgi:hypothetical protein